MWRRSRVETQEGDWVRSRVEDALGERVSGVDPVLRSGHPLPDVWKVTTGRRVLAVKRQVFAPMVRDSNHDLLEVETVVSSRLRACGCSLPAVLASDAANDLVMLEWCGDRTLDDVCQEDGDQETETLRRRIVDPFTDLERGFEESRDDLSSRCFPGCDAESLQAAWRKAAIDVGEQFPDLISKSGDFVGALHQAEWEALIVRMESAPPTLGSIDYNARNIVVRNSGSFTFLEFSKIGWDWPERRLIQYGTSLGAGRPNGKPVCLISRAAAEQYGEVCDSWRGITGDEAQALLDAHHLVFYTLMAARLLQLAKLPESDQRRVAWPNVDERLEVARSALGDCLSDDKLVTAIRKGLTEKG